MDRCNSYRLQINKLCPMSRPFKHKVSPAYLRSELDKRSISTQVLASLAGYADRTSVNAMLRDGAISEQVAAALEKLSIPY